jgi:hypothetical protein
LNVRAALVVLGSFAVACAQIVGIGNFPGEGDAGSDAQGDVASDGPSGFCSSGKAVVTSSTPLDFVSASTGFVFPQSFNVGLGRCATGSTCTNPQSILSLAPGDSFDNAAVGSSIVYSAEGTSTGSIHRTAIDGTNDMALFSASALAPGFVALGGGNVVYWVNGYQPAEVHCIGCSGSGDTLWIDTVQAPTALFADATAVYVAAYDSTNVTYGIYGCGAAMACGTQPRVVIEGLSQTSITPSNVASDGTRVYVPREATSEIVGVDTLGNVKAIVTKVQATALAVDATTGELFYGTSTGLVARTKGDGSAASVTLSTCAKQIDAIAFDATNVYALATTDTSESTVFAIPR